MTKNIFEQIDKIEAEMASEEKENNMSDTITEEKKKLDEEMKNTVESNPDRVYSKFEIMSISVKTAVIFAAVIAVFVLFFNEIFLFFPAFGRPDSIVACFAIYFVVFKVFRKGCLNALKEMLLYLYYNQKKNS